MSNQKYVRLNEEQTEMTSAVFNVKPNPIKRHPDEIIHTFNWYMVVEHKPSISDNELYQHELESWEVIDNKVHITYKVVPRNDEIVREVLEDRVNQARNANMRSGITFNGIPVDTDEITVIRIIGLSLEAVANPEFQTSFIGQNNQIVTLNAEQIIALGRAVGHFETANVFTARHAKDAIIASENPAEFDVDAIEWPSKIYPPVSGE